LAQKAIFTVNTQLMSKIEEFLATMTDGYSFEGESMVLGGTMLDGEPQHQNFVRIPYSTLNRHGLIAGATGTGKTKTLQILAEQLSSAGVPSLLMDIKGDLSGIAAESPGHKKIDERHEAMGLPFVAGTSPVEFLSLSAEKGVRLRATVTEFGPVLFSKILGLNDTQEGIVSVIFKYCDDNEYPLLDLDDFKKTLQYIAGDGKKEIEGEYGRIASSSVGSIMRKIVELEQQGADTFFGEPSFEVNDLLRRDASGKGIVSILRLTDIQDKPKLFSTFMLQLLAEIYSTFPEEGDRDKPKLVLFIDEAHLVFKEASDALMSQLEAIIKLIRSKAVGIIFVTQNPTDIPEDILGQLGLKIQHALRAFTAKDRKAIKLAAENYPLTDYYDVDQLLTELGIGEAIVSALNEKGRPTPLAHCLLRAPQSRMDILKNFEINKIIDDSLLIPEYNVNVDRESASEILTAKMKSAKEEERQAELRKEREKAEKEQKKSTRKTTRKNTSRRRRSEPKSTIEEVMDSKAGNTILKELTRGLLGILGVKKSGRGRKTSSWF